MIRELFPKEIYPINYSTLSPNMKTSDLGRTFFSLSNHISRHNFSQGVHTQTSWPLALVIPQTTTLQFAVYATTNSSEFASLLSAYEDRQSAPYQLMFMHNRGKIDTDNHPGLREYTRQTNLEIMLTTSKRSTVRVYKDNRKESLIVVAHSPEYEILIRLALLLPGIYHLDLAATTIDILMTWLKYAKDEISEESFQLYLSENASFKRTVEELRRAAITNLVNGFYVSQRNLLLSECVSYQSQIEVILRSYTITYDELEQAQRTLLGYDTNSASKQKDLNDFIDILGNSPAVKEVNPRDNKLSCTFSVPGNNIDLDVLERFKTSRYSESPVALRIIDKLWFSGRYELILQACIILPMPGVTLIRDIEASYKQEYGLPNYHIQKFNCFGSNAMAITKAAKQGNFIHMLSAIIASVMNINLMDSTVWTYFNNTILQGEEDTYHAIKDKTTGTQVTCRRFYADTIRELEAENLEQRTRQAAEDARLRERTEDREHPDQPDPRDPNGDGAHQAETARPWYETPIQPQAVRTNYNTIEVEEVDDEEDEDEDDNEDFDTDNIRPEVAHETN